MQEAVAIARDAARMQPRLGRAGDAPLRFAGLAISVTDDLDGFQADWEALGTTARFSAFQSWAWLEAWCVIAAPAIGERPVIVIGRDDAGSPRLILPLGVTRRLGLKALGWLGQSHANYGMGIIAPDLAPRLEPAQVQALLARVARMAGADVVHLARQPSVWDAIANPFAALAATRDVNDSYILALEPDFAAQEAGLFSARTRAGLRRKERKLAGFGEVRVLSGSARAEALIESFLAQKRGQLAEAGVASDFDRPAICDVYRAMARAGILDVHALSVSGEPAATVVAARHQGRVYMLNTSLAEGRVREASPGALLIRHHVETAASGGATHYDFGPGDAPYKRDWEPKVVALTTTVLAVTARGAALAAALGAVQATKRTIKRTPVLWSLAKRVRRLIAR